MQTVSLEKLASSLPEHVRSEGELLFEQAFDCLMWSQVINNVIENISALETWHHRQTADIELDLAYLGIDRDQLLSALSAYLASPALASKQADWFFLNVLTYAEYLATINELRRKLMGVQRYVRSLHPPADEHIADVSVFTYRHWHIPAMMSVVAISWALHPVAGAGVIAYAAYRSHQKRKVVKEVNATLAAMLQTYLSFNTTDLSWTQVMKILEKSRECGVIWDASLYALAQRRILAPIEWSKPCTRARPI